MRKMILTFLALVLFSNNAFGMIMGNDSCRFLSPDTCNTSGGDGGDSTQDGKILKESTLFYPGLGQLIAESGTYFYRSRAFFVNLLATMEESELIGVDQAAMEGNFYRSYQFLLMAVDTYYELNQAAVPYEYNGRRLKSLSLFHYESYRESRAHNPAIFNRVKRFLKNGDIKGIYNYFYEESSGILDEMETLKTEIEKGKFPSIGKVWEINRRYIDLLLFGQIVAEISMSS